VRWVGWEEPTEEPLAEKSICATRAFAQYCQLSGNGWLKRFMRSTPEEENPETQDGNQEFEF